MENIILGIVVGLIFLYTAAVLSIPFYIMSIDNKLEKIEKILERRKASL